MVSVSIIGVGRVGGALALALPVEKYTITNLINRPNRESGEVAEKSNGKNQIISLENTDEIGSDVIFITTQDSEIANVAVELSKKIKTPSLVFHTSGSYSSSILEPLLAVGCKVGSIHPLVSISNPETGAERFRGAFFCVEGEQDAVEMGKSIVSDLGGVPFCIDTKFKVLYHAAAVTACGHIVALLDAAVEMMTKCGLSSDDSQKLLMPLVRSTVNNLSEQSISSALTGTFARADIETFTRHLAALNENVSDELLEIYLLLGERSLELAVEQGISRDRVDTLRAKVSIAKSKLRW